MFCLIYFGRLFVLFSFDIVDWSIWSPNAQDNEKPDIKHIPLMTRRRFSQLTSMVAKVGSSLVCKDEQIPIFFFSNFSEINKHYEMTSLILETGDTSPALFSFSTFNASAAQFSILNKNHSSVLAMSSQNRAVETALIMANVHLQVHNVQKALILIGEEAVPQAYKSASLDYYRLFEKQGVFCLALLISRDDHKYELTNCNAADDADDGCCEDSVLSLIDFLSTEKKSVVLDSVVLKRL